MTIEVNATQLRHLDEGARCDALNPCEKAGWCSS